MQPLNLSFKESDRPLDSDGRPMFAVYHRFPEPHIEFRTGRWKDLELARIPVREARIVGRGQEPTSPEQLAAELEYIEKYLEHDNNYDEHQSTYTEEENANFEKYELHCSACGGFSMYDERIVLRAPSNWFTLGKRPECPHCKRICTVHDIGD